MATIHDIDVDDFLRDCVAVEPTALEEEFVRLPADLAYWNERYARAYKNYAVAKIARERTGARLNIQLREEINAQQTDPKAKAKGPTVDAVAAQVDNHADMIAARDAEIDAEVEKVRLYGVLDAVRSKKDMLVQIGAHIRVEMQNDPVLREQMLGTRRSRDGG